MEKSLESLLIKYAQPGGRYAVYPLPGLWKCNFSESERIKSLKKNYSCQRGVDVYIHIPFCKSLCTFCGCNIKVTSDHGVETPYLNALLREWNFYHEILIEPKINSIYVGGGTPHFFSPDNLQQLFENIIGRHQDKNFSGTMEVDPREISYEHLKLIRQWGFKRIILGVQDFDRKVLKNVNRDQSFDQVLSVVVQARKLGFEEIVVEWIYGLPMQTPETFQESLKYLRELNPEGVALYPLAKVPWQSSGQAAFGRYELPDTKERALLYRFVWEGLCGQGFKNIGMGYFFQPSSLTYKAFEQGRLGRNMTGLVENRSSVLIGIGAGSIGRSESLLWQNEKVVEKYQQQVFRGKGCVTNFHNQSVEERVREDFFEQLLCSSESSQKYFPVHRGLFDELLEDGILEKMGDEIKPTLLGRHFLKAVFQSHDPYS